MSEKTKTCPICPRGCDLSAPSCRRGEEYVKTGEFPAENEANHKHGHFHNGENHHHGGAHHHGHHHGHHHREMD
jgi:hypothetical protein